MDLRLLFASTIILGSLIPSAGAEPYWIAYEGNDYPENEGWTRRFRDENGWDQGGAERTLENGVLRLDTSRSDMICDYYGISRQMNPEPGETFIAEWRVNVIEAIRSTETSVWIARDETGSLSLGYMEDEIWIDTEHWSYAIEPHVFHTYRVESADMNSYSLWIDEEHVHDGIFYTPTSLNSFLSFGDPGYGGAVTSVSQWDYVRFGVVPESDSMAMALLIFGISHICTRR